VEDFQPALVPNREQTFGVGELELHFALAAPVANAPPQAVPGNQFQRQFTQRQGYVLEQGCLQLAP
jgi:hypothetical protein